MIISYHTHQLPGSFTHSHAEYEITYCVCGDYEFHYEDFPGKIEARQIKPKTMIFMPKGVSHGVEKASYPYQRYFISLPVHQAIEWLYNPILLSPFQSFVVGEDGKKRSFPQFLETGASAPIVEGILERLLSVQIFSDVDNSNADLHMRCLLGLLFCELNTHHPGFFAMHYPAKSSLITKVRADIEQNFHQPLLIEELAKRYFVHPNHLTHCFTRQIGISPRKYLTNLRLANARKLLEAEDCSVQDVALRVGFSNVNNFIQSFRGRYGLTPRAYRKKATTEMMG